MYSTSSLEKVSFLTLRKVKYSSSGVAVLKIRSMLGRLLQAVKSLLRQKLCKGRRCGDDLAVRNFIRFSRACYSSSEVGTSVKTSYRYFVCLWTARLIGEVWSSRSNSYRQFEV
jgi:hypothetical protein